MALEFERRIELELRELFPDRQDGEIRLAATFAVSRTCQLLTRHGPGCIARMRMREASLATCESRQLIYPDVAAYAPRTLRALRYGGWYKQ